MKNAKTGIKLIAIIIAVIALAFIVSRGLTIASSFSFAGYTWDYSVNQNNQGSNSVGSCSGSAGGGETAVLSIDASAGNNGIGCRTLMVSQQQINSVDEFLVLYDFTAIANDDIMGAGGGIFLSDAAGATQYLSFSENLEYLQRSKYFEPKIVKVKNNFDGTWSILTSVGVGDLFVLRQKSSIPKDLPLYLAFQVNAGGGAGGSRASSSMKIYNIGRKETGFAVCKADEYVKDLNNDGRITSDECFSSSIFVLNSEEFVKESDFEKQQRLIQELQAKNSGLTADVEALKQQTASQSNNLLLKEELAKLQAELQETRAILADVQAGDKAVINVITAQEQFRRSNAFIEFLNKIINKIIAWFKSLKR